MLLILTKQSQCADAGVYQGLRFSHGLKQRNSCEVITRGTLFGLVQYKDS